MKKKLTNKEIELILANTRATLAMEGLTPTKEEEDINRKYLSEEITEDEALKALDNLFFSMTSKSLNS